MKKIPISRWPTLFILFAFLSNACSTSTEIPIATSTIQATETPAPAHPTLTLEPTIPFIVNQSCWPVLPLKKGGDINGSLLFGTYNPAYVFAWDISSFRTKKLDENVQTDWMLAQEIISPDGKAIASVPYNESKLVLTSYDKSITFPLPDGNYGGVIKFLANGEIVIGGNTPDLWVGNYVNGSGLTVPYYIFDPMTGDLKSYSVFLSGFTLGVQGSYPFEFSSDMNYIIYQNTPKSDGSARFTLKDLRTDIVIWTGPLLPANRFATNGDLPHWKPNSDTLVNILWESGQQDYFGNYFSMSLDGAVTQLTKFHQTGLIGIGRVGLLLPSWSPDGRYMAFRVVQPGQSSLYVWDDQEKVAYRPCLPDESQADSGYFVYWSFDSNHLLLRLAYPDPGSLATPTNLLPTYHTANVILDMATKTILQLPSENDRGQYSTYKGSVTPLGWVNWQLP